MSRNDSSNSGSFLSSFTERSSSPKDKLPLSKRIVPLVLLGVGFIVLCSTVLWPLLQVTVALDWHATLCTIRESEVIGDDAYKVHVVYTYEYDSVEYSGDQFSFFNTQTGGKESKQAAVDQLPVGSESICYVNPSRPAESVLNRHVTSQIFWGIFAVPFLWIGGFLWLRRFVPAADEEVYHDDQSVSDLDEDWDDEERSSEEELEEQPFEGQQRTPVITNPLILKPDSTRLGRLAGVLFLTICLNAIAFLFVADRIEDWLAGKWQLIPELIYAPFIVAAMVLWWACAHCLLGLRNPFPAFVLSRTSIPVGEEALLAWTFEKSIGSIRALRIVLIGYERTYQRSRKNEVEVRNLFYAETIFQTTEPDAIQHRQVRVPIPQGTMHSQDGKRMQIIWELEVQGQIRFWPDVHENYVIQVSPKP